MNAREKERCFDVIGMILGLIAISAIAFLMSGCFSYGGAKVVEGRDLSVGMTIPNTEGNAQLDFMNYLSGFRLGVAENAKLKVKYTVAETNEYFGCIYTRIYKMIDAQVDPCEVSPTEDRQGTK